MRDESRGLGMSTSAAKVENDQVAVDVKFDNDMICLMLEDGREVRTPLEFYPRLRRLDVF